MCRPSLIGPACFPARGEHAPQERRKTMAALLDACGHVHSKPSCRIATIFGVTVLNTMVNSSG
jgi:hypothetical protein